MGEEGRALGRLRGEALAVERAKGLVRRVPCRDRQLAGRLGASGVAIPRARAVARAIRGCGGDGG